MADLAALVALWRISRMFIHKHEDLDGKCQMDSQLTVRPWSCGHSREMWPS